VGSNIFQIKITGMRKLILGLAVSLDGFIEGPNGEFDWCFTDQDYGMRAFFERVDSSFMGRKSFEVVQAMGEAAEFPGMPRLKEYIFSNTLTDVGPERQLVTGDAATAVKRIKAEPGKDIWLFGGASLTSSLLQEELVDELWLSIHPIILGSGKPLFTGLQQRISLQLTETLTYDTGLVSVKYTILPSSKKG
jgi:dihydrofolate reductase